MSIGHPIPYGRQYIDDADVLAVTKALRSEFLTQGPCVEEYEIALATKLACSFVSVVSSATSALHISLLALGVKQDDIVWTSAITFAATSNAALYIGARVEFLDININNGLICEQLLEQKLRATPSDHLPKVLICVQYGGSSCNMKMIWELSKIYGFKVLEDASHALGSRYKSIPVGACTYSDMCVFSTHPVKMITTGEGGVITTNSRDLSDKTKLLRSHGITKDPHLLSEFTQSPWYYLQTELGYNYRISDLQAALGISQLKKLNDFVHRRRDIHYRYSTGLSSCHSYNIVQDSLDSESCFHLVTLQIKGKNLATRRSKLYNWLKDDGINTQVHYIPVYKHPYYASNGHSSTFLPNTEFFYSCILTLPVYYSLTSEEQDYVIARLLHYAE
jgi:UDP-4-amino-4,6-dideoxy-N-acetyl-beta-L-altrosamine transaminase